MRIRPTACECRPPLPPANLTWPVLGSPAVELCSSCSLPRRQLHGPGGIDYNKVHGLLCACNAVRVPYGPPPGTVDIGTVRHGYEHCEPTDADSAVTAASTRRRDFPTIPPLCECGQPMRLPCLIGIGPGRRWQCASCAVAQLAAGRRPYERPTASSRQTCGGTGCVLAPGHLGRCAPLRGPGEG